MSSGENSGSGDLCTLTGPRIGLRPQHEMRAINVRVTVRHKSWRRLRAGPGSRSDRKATEVRGRLRGEKLPLAFSPAGTTVGYGGGSSRANHGSPAAALRNEP